MNDEDRPLPPDPRLADCHSRSLAVIICRCIGIAHNSQSGKPVKRDTVGMDQWELSLLAACVTIIKSAPHCWMQKDDVAGRHMRRSFFGMAFSGARNRKSGRNTTAPELKIRLQQNKATSFRPAERTNRRQHCGCSGAQYMMDGAAFSEPTSTAALGSPRYSPVKAQMAIAANIAGIPRTGSSPVPSTRKM